MRKKIILLLVLVPVISCNKSDPTGSDFQLGTVPFESGRASVYAWSIGFRDSAGNVVEMLEDTFEVRVAGIGETVGSMTGLVRLEAKPVQDDTLVTSVWYAQSTADLREVAYSGAGRVPVIQPKLHKWSIANVGVLRHTEFYTEPYLVRSRFCISQMGVDSVLIRDDPRIVYQYPLVVGAQWRSFTTPFIQTREVVGVEQDTVPAGMFVCLRIRTTIPEFGTDLIWDDLVSTEGLIQRTLETTMLTSNSDMSVVDTVTYVERLELIHRQ
jgi:hypothetical protein